MLRVTSSMLVPESSTPTRPVRVESSPSSRRTSPSTVGCGRSSPTISRLRTLATSLSATGPFASHARRAWPPGVALVGDAADFFDPFTGEGIYAALRGGEMLAPWAREALAARTTQDASRALAVLTRDGTSVSTAVRTALIDAARRKAAAAIRAEAEKLATDEADRAEVMQVLRDMETLRAW